MRDPISMVKHVHQDKGRISFPNFQDLILYVFTVFSRAAGTFCQHTGQAGVLTPCMMVKLGPCCQTWPKPKVNQSSKILKDW